MRLLKFPGIVSFMGVCLSASLLAGQDGRTRRHQEDPAWESVQQHLPDLATSSAQVLEAQGDLLRVRQFPEDALDFYAGARKQVGDSAALLNKIGLAHLALRHLVLAEGCFLQALKLDPHNPHAWNNLGATEYLQRRYSEAVGDYKRAIRLARANAIFHANMSTAYFEWKNEKASLREAEEALDLDPQVFQQESRTSARNPLSVQDHLRFAMTMAPLYARRRQEPEMLAELNALGAAGTDIASFVANDPDLARYRNDPRVVQLVERSVKVPVRTALLAVRDVPAENAARVQ